MEKPERPRGRSGRPPAILFQVLPPSVDLKRPSPQDTLLRGLPSPDPTQTMSGFDGAMATSPRTLVVVLSKMEAQESPLEVVFHNPPEAVATYIVAGLLSWT